MSDTQVRARADSLREHIRDRRQQGALDVGTIEARKQAELAFHDRTRDIETREQLDQDEFDLIYGNERFYKVTESSNNYMFDWLAQYSRDAIFLDFACGNGGNAIRAAQAGAQLSVGIDLSPVSIENAEKIASEAGVGETCEFLQADCENTGFPDGSIDTVVCCGVLHHMDLSFAMPELRRILAPGGRILAVEALAVNPVIQLYRNRTPAMRTEWEKNHILGPKDLKFASRFFDIGDVRYWHLASLGAAYAPRMLAPLEALDGVLTRVPGVRQLAWVFTFELIRQ